MNRSLNLLLISGSLREASTNTAVLRTASELAGDGLTATLYAGIQKIPAGCKGFSEGEIVVVTDDDDREGEAAHAAVADLRAQIAAADAILLCTPEYAGALPGALKNLLEWTVGDGGTYRKPIAWINASGPAAPTGGADAHDSLRKVLGYVHADIVETACMRIPLTRDAVGADGTVTDPAAREHIAEAVAALARHVLDRDSG